MQSGRWVGGSLVGGSVVDGFNKTLNFQRLQQNMLIETVHANYLREAK